MEGICCLREPIEDSVLWIRRWQVRCSVLKTVGLGYLYVGDIGSSHGVKSPLHVDWRSY